MTAPLHLKKDLSRLCYDRTLAEIRRSLEAFGNDADLLTPAAHGALEAALLVLYSSARLTLGPSVTPAMVYKLWGEQMAHQFDLMHKGYDVAEATLAKQKEKAS